MPEFPALIVLTRCEYHVLALLSIFLGPEEEERSEHSEDQIREESECREVLRSSNVKVVLKRKGLVMVDDCSERAFATMKPFHSLHSLSPAGPMGGFHRYCRADMTTSSRMDWIS